MISRKFYLLCAAASLFLFIPSGCQTMNTKDTSKNEASSLITGSEKAPHVEAISTETASRTIEDGGTGPYKALMVSDSTLATHTLFRPEDMNNFDKNNKLPIIAWGNGACANSPWEHVNFLSEIASYGFLVIAIIEILQIL